MQKRIIAKAALDGFLHAFILIGLLEAASSVWAVGWSVDDCVLLMLGTALVSVGVYVLILRRVRKRRQINRITLLSIGFCLLTMLASLIRLVSFHFRFLPAREMNVGDGLLLLLMTGGYLLFSGALRGIVWIAMAEWCLRRELAVQ